MARKSLLIHVFAHDEPGLVSAISGRLFDLGLNLGDSSFAVLGTGAEFTAVVEEPVPVGIEEIEQQLRALPELEDGEVRVEQVGIEPEHGPSAEVTHRIVIQGADQPGLIARLSEVFGDYGANIVRLTAERQPFGERAGYLIQVSAWIPEARADACISAVTNTASQLQLFSQWHRT
ncbi:MAG: ACT domain-containing protein [Halofilum sp. (in: g-proteobacteria)]